MIGNKRGKIMDVEDKLKKMYKDLYGEPSRSCSLELWYDEYDEHELLGVKVMKDGNICSTYTKSDLLFDYITKEWK
jgi:hypothetical protein